MTENKKRGRPPGSGKGSKNRPKITNAEDAYKELAEMSTPREAAEIKAKVNGMMGLKPKSTFPDNWDSLGKIERLQWLTEHKR